MPGGSVSSLIEGRDNDVHMCKIRQAIIHREREQLCRYQQLNSDFEPFPIRKQDEPSEKLNLQDADEQLSNKGN